MIRPGLTSGLLALWVTLLGATATATVTAAAPSKTTINPRDQARAQAKAEVKKAQLAYKLARFEEALEGFSRAYELYPMPALLFNLGQCHRNLKNYERAIFFFEGYLHEQPRIAPDQKALTESLLDESRTAFQRQNSEAAATAARFAAPALAASPAGPGMQRAAMRDPSVRYPSGDARQTDSGTAPPLLASDDRDRPAGAKPITHRWWFWTAIGGAVAAGALAYYATGDPRLVAPTGTVGTLDRR